MFPRIRHLGTYADTRWRNSATCEKRRRHNFVTLNGHVSIYCSLGISLVPNYIFSDEIEHLSGIYAVARFNSRQQLTNVLENNVKSFLIFLIAEHTFQLYERTTKSFFSQIGCTFAAFGYSLAF